MERRRFIGLLGAGLITACAADTGKSKYVCGTFNSRGEATCVEASQQNEDVSSDNQEITASKNYWRAITTGGVDDVINAMQPEHIANRRNDSMTRRLIQQNIDLYRNCANTGFNDQKTTVESLRNDRVVTLHLANSCEIPFSGTTMTVRKVVMILGQSANGRWLPKAAPTPMS